jgi:Glycosyltransferase Family 4
MKIGFVLDDTLDSTDGVQQYVLTLGKWLKDQGHDVHYLVGATKRRDIPDVHSLSRNMSVRFNGNQMSMPLPAKKFEITALLSTEKFDVLHVQVPYSPLLAHRVIMAAPPQTAIIGTFHIAPNSASYRPPPGCLRQSYAHRSNDLTPCSASATLQKNLRSVRMGSNGNSPECRRNLSV